MGVFGNSEWMIPAASVRLEQDWIFSWARNPNALPQDVLSNWDWLPLWWNTLSAKIWLPLGLSLIILFLSLLLNYIKKWTKENDTNLYFLYIPLIFSILFWFFTAPDPRFIGAVPGLYIFLSIYLFYTKINFNIYNQTDYFYYLNKFKFTIFFILFLIVTFFIMFAFKLGTGLGLINILHLSSLLFGLSELGINRNLIKLIILFFIYIFLNNNIKLKNYFLFKLLKIIILFSSLIIFFKYINLDENFPINWEKEPRINTLEKSTSSGLKISIPQTGDRCWLSSLPCTPYYNSELALKKFTIFNLNFFEYGFYIKDFK
jgi:hypothetical protein